MNRNRTVAVDANSQNFDPLTFDIIMDMKAQKTKIDEVGSKTMAIHNKEKTVVSGDLNNS